MIEVFGFDVSRLSGVGLWIGFWFVANAVCYWFVGAFVTRSKEQGRLALRAVSIVHAAMAIPELIQTVEMWNKGKSLFVCLFCFVFFFFFLKRFALASYCLRRIFRLAVRCLVRVGSRILHLGSDYCLLLSIWNCFCVSWALVVSRVSLCRNW
jgi:uncharacterized ion transporter superfamily protein YfcC